MRSSRTRSRTASVFSSDGLSARCRRRSSGAECPGIYLLLGITAPAAEKDEEDGDLTISDVDTDEDTILSGDGQDGTDDEHVPEVMEDERAA